MEMRVPLFRWLTVVAVALLFCRASVSGETVRVATFNVRNYLPMDRVVAEGWRPEYPKSEPSKTALRAAIMAVEPDVLALQEMGAEPFLRELQRDLRAEGLDFPYAHHFSGHDEERHLAILSRIPFVEVHEHADATFGYFGETVPMRRGLLEAVFLSGGERWSLFTVHLKSKWTEREEDPEAQQRRTGEATAARDRILERYDPEAGALFVIAGDFNDTRDTPPLRRFLTRGEVVISEILPAADGDGESWTHHWEKQDLYSRVDFLLVSPEMGKRAEEGRGHVYDGPAAREASDHRMVWADFRFGEKEKRMWETTGDGAKLAEFLREFGKRDR